jgi:hypothetical protein
MGTRSIWRWTWVPVAVLVAMAAPARADELAEAPIERPSFFVAVDGAMGVQSWGGAHLDAVASDPTFGALADPDLQSGFFGGVRIAGLYAISEMFHLGLSFAYQAGELELEAEAPDRFPQAPPLRFVFGETMHDLAPALVGKLAFRLTPTFVLGGVLDLGPFFQISSDSGEHFSSGLRLFPRASIDAFFWEGIGVSAALGLVIDPVVTGEMWVGSPGGPSPVETDFDYWAVRPMLLIGVIAGL